MPAKSRHEQVIINRKTVVEESLVEITKKRDALLAEHDLICRIMADADKEKSTE